jgi:hypothetical protein
MIRATQVTLTIQATLVTTWETLATTVVWMIASAPAYAKTVSVWRAALEKRAVARWGFVRQVPQPPRTPVWSV